jgi:hypothetical protein
MLLNVVMTMQASTASNQMGSVNSTKLEEKKVILVFFGPKSRLKRVLWFRREKYL